LEKLIKLLHGGTLPDQAAGTITNSFYQQLLVALKIQLFCSTSCGVAVLHIA